MEGLYQMADMRVRSSQSKASLIKKGCFSSPTAFHLAEGNLTLLASGQGRSL